MSREPARTRILVVDDDDDARVALERLLRAEGFSTSTAGDGAAALAEARRDPPTSSSRTCRCPA